MLRITFLLHLASLVVIANGRSEFFDKKHWSNDAIVGAAFFTNFIPGAGPFIFPTLMGINTLARINPCHGTHDSISAEELDRQFERVAHAIQESKTQIPNEVEIDSRLSDLKKIITGVRTLHRRYNHMFRSRRLRKDSEEAMSFVNSFYTDRNFEAPLELMKEILIGDQQKMNLLENLAMIGDLETHLCRRHYSHQSRLIRIRQDVLITEFMAMELAIFAYNVTVKTTNSSDIKEKALVELEYFFELFKNRTMDIQPYFVEAIRQASRYFWKCDPASYHSEGNTFVALDPVFRTHVIEEIQMRSSHPNPEVDTIVSVNDQCSHHGSEARNIEVFYKKNELKCRGRIHDCYKGPHNAVVCYNKANDRVKLEAIKFYHGDTWGTNDTCTNQSSFEKNSKFGAPIDVCLCKCDEIQDDRAVRYFSTLMCTSDVGKNKVITGVRLIKRGMYIHFEIQQAVMGGYANVDMNTVEWTQNCTNRPESDFALEQNLYKVTWDNRSVNLDDLECPNDSVVSGVRFNNDQGSLRLELQCTPFNSTSGILNLDRHNIIAVTGERKSLEIDNHLPTATGNTDVLAKYGSKIKFTTSNDGQDAGSTVVPFIDIQKVTEKVPSPLAGVSLIHRGHKLSSGYLALQIKPFDYSQYLQVDHAEHYNQAFKKFLEAIGNTISSVTSEGFIPKHQTSKT